jgi:hypothetical protein
VGRVVGVALRVHCATLAQATTLATGGLIDGIEEHGQDPRWRSRSLGPVLLGSSMWIDDDELIDKLGSLTACIVVTKQGRDQRKLQRLRELNERTAGVPIRACPGLGGLAPKADGEPEVVRPYSQFDDTCCAPFAATQSRVRLLDGATRTASRRRAVPG